MVLKETGGTPCCWHILYLDGIGVSWWEDFTGGHHWQTLGRGCMGSHGVIS